MHPGGAERRQRPPCFVVMVAHDQRLRKREAVVAIAMILGDSAPERFDCRLAADAASCRLKPGGGFLPSSGFMVGSGDTSQNEHRGREHHQRTEEHDFAMYHLGRPATNTVAHRGHRGNLSTVRCESITSWSANSRHW